VERKKKRELTVSEMKNKREWERERKKGERGEERKDKKGACRKLVKTTAFCFSSNL
jgi:hypothetical protein